MVTTRIIDLETLLALYIGGCLILCETVMQFQGGNDFVDDKKAKMLLSCNCLKGNILLTQDKKARTNNAIS